jgi:hypothetical protein
MKIFISHSSADKDFVENLAWRLKRFGVDVWYDGWEIKVGDSIIEKVFDGLEKSDALVLVLSKASVKSRWVKEELNTAAIRRIDDNDILILPVLKEDCDIPTVLRQLRYADFRIDQENGLMELLDTIEPLHTLWQSLKYLREHLSLVIEKVKASNLDDFVGEQVDNLNELMSTALDVRCQIELRHAKVKAEHQDFFQKIGILAEKGLDIRSQTWNSLVNYRAAMAHRTGNDFGFVRVFARYFQDRYGSSDDKENLHQALDRLEEIMRIICEEPISIVNRRD